MNITNPKISIVTPSYNQGAFIEDAIKSVLAQNYDNFEHIIIDGDSKDNTLEILKMYPHLIWISEPDEGQSDAINKGFRKATGNIIGWLNTDDYYLPNTFSIVAKELSKDNVNAIYANFRYIDSIGNITRVIITQKPKKWISTIYSFMPSTTFFFKREILEKGLIIDTQFKIAMDMEFFAHIYYSGYRIRKVDAYFAHFRWHENNKSLDFKPVRLIRIREGLEIFNRYSGIKLPKNKYGIFFYNILIHFVCLYRFLCRNLIIGLYSKN